jgi:hypothetical protein
MRATRIAGIVILVIGLLILAVGAVLYTMNGTTSTNLLASNNYLIAAGDNRAVGVTLNAGQTLSGKYTQVNGSTVNFYFMTANQQNQFGNCAPCSSPAIVNASAPASYSFNWSINSSGTYYLVLDNSKGGANVAVTLTANANGSGQSMTTTYLLVLGAIVAVIGAIVIAIPSGKKKTPMVAQTVSPNDQSR